MFNQAINEFRKENGKNEPHWLDEEKYNCLQHCWAMIKVNKLYHAEEYLLNGLNEGVGVISYNGEYILDIARRIIFDMFGKSEEHANILLNSNNLAVNYCINNYQLWVTFRGS